MNGFSDFINKTEMVSFGSFARTIGWFIVVIMFSTTSCVILLRDAETYMTWGIQLAGFVIGGLLGASGIGAYNHKVVRETSDKYAPVIEAKERGKVAGAAAAAVIKETAADAKAARANGVTAERPAVTVDDERGSE